MSAWLALGLAATTALAAASAALAAAAGGRRYRDAIATLADRGLADQFLFVDPARLLRWSLAALGIVVAAGYALGGGLVALLGTGLVAAAAPRWLQRRLRRRRERRLVLQLPDALAALAGALRAGVGLAQALATVADQQPAPLAHEFALVLRKQRLGLPLDQALIELATRVPCPEYALFVACVRIARELGSNLAESLERLADTLRRKQAMEDRIRALTAQGKLQGWIVGALPLLLMAVLGWLEPRAMQTLWTTPVGWAVLGVLGVLLGVGALLIARIVRIDV